MSNQTNCLHGSDHFWECAYMHDSLSILAKTDQHTRKTFHSFPHIAEKWSSKQDTQEGLPCNNYPKNYLENTDIDSSSQV